MSKVVLDPAEHLIVALDGMDKSEALLFISKLPQLRWVKVGLELFVNSGPEFLKELRDNRKKIFLDLKFHDIPTTMARACRQAAMTGAELITVHACAGEKALYESNKAALEGAFEAGFEPPTLLAVTVLTSWTSKSLNEDLALNQSIDQRVDTLAKLAFNSGVGGCVCSPLEVNSLRKVYPLPFELVTPGIRPMSAEPNDQARVMTASMAFEAGANRLVIGRPITKSDDPLRVFDLFCEELIGIQRN